MAAHIGAPNRPPRVSRKAAKSGGAVSHPTPAVSTATTRHSMDSLQRRAASLFMSNLGVLFAVRLMDIYLFEVLQGALMGLRPDHLAPELYRSDALASLSLAITR